MLQEVLFLTDYFLGINPMTSINNIIRLLHDEVKMQKKFESLKLQFHEPLLPIIHFIAPVTDCTKEKHPKNCVIDKYRGYY